MPKLFDEQIIDPAEQPPRAALTDDVGQPLIRRPVDVDGERLVQGRFELLPVVLVMAIDSARLTCGDRRVPPDSSTARAKCRRAFSMDPPAEACPASHEMKKSCSDPFSHVSSSASARRIIFSMAVWRMDSSESVTSRPNAAAQAAPVQ